MYKKYINFLLLFFVVICMYSCVDTRKATYFVGASNASLTQRSEDTIASVIQQGDILNITISSLNAEASAIFNMPNNSTVGAAVTNTGNIVPSYGYLVNIDGNVQIPILGNIRVSGYTAKQVKDRVTETLVEKKLLIDPIVTIRRLNYEVTVIGEVTKPTVINVPNEKISLLKALGLAGDITIYGKKDNVLLIRELNGKRTTIRLDLNSPEFLRSQYYYLQPNDVVYVEANSTKISNATAFRQILPIVLSGLSVILLALDRIIK